MGACFSSASELPPPPPPAPQPLLALPPPPALPAGPPSSPLPQLHSVRVDPPPPPWGAGTNGALVVHINLDLHTAPPTHFRVQAFAVRGGQAAVDAGNKRASDEHWAELQRSGNRVIPRYLYPLHEPDPRLTRVVPAAGWQTCCRYDGLTPRAYYVFAAASVSDEGEGLPLLSNASMPRGRRNFHAFRARLNQVNKEHFGDGGSHDDAASGSPAADGLGGAVESGGQAEVDRCAELPSSPDSSSPLPTPPPSAPALLPLRLPPRPPSGPPGPLQALYAHPPWEAPINGVLLLRLGSDRNFALPTHYRVQVHTVRGGKAAVEAANKKVDEELEAMQAAGPGPWVMPLPVFELDGPDPRLTRVIHAEEYQTSYRYGGLTPRTYYVFAVSGVNDAGEGPPRLTNASKPRGRRNFHAFRARLNQVNKEHFGDGGSHDDAASGSPLADGLGGAGESDGQAEADRCAGGGSGDANGDGGGGLGGQADRTSTVGDGSSEADDSAGAEPEDRPLPSGGGAGRSSRPAVRFAEEVSVRILPSPSDSDGNGDGDGGGWGDQGGGADGADGAAEEAATEAAVPVAAAVERVAPFASAVT